MRLLSVCVCVRERLYVVPSWNASTSSLAQSINFRFEMGNVLPAIIGSSGTRTLTHTHTLPLTEIAAEIAKQLKHNSLFSPWKSPANIYKSVVFLADIFSLWSAFLVLKCDAVVIIDRTAKRWPQCFAFNYLISARVLVFCFLFSIVFGSCFFGLRTIESLLEILRIVRTPNNFDASINCDKLTIVCYSTYTRQCDEQKTPPTTLESVLFNAPQIDRIDARLMCLEMFACVLCKLIGNNTSARAR